MLTKEITFKDFRGTERKRTYHFQLNRVEAVRMMAKYDGDLEAWLKNRMAENDTAAIVQCFEDIILTSVGVISPDGIEFDKVGVATKFEQTNAYANLFEELLTSPDSMAEFVKGIIPENFEASVEEAPKLQPVTAPVKAPSAQDELARLQREHPELFNGNTQPNVNTIY